MFQKQAQRGPQGLGKKSGPGALGKKSGKVIIMFRSEERLDNDVSHLRNVSSATFLIYVFHSVDKCLVRDVSHLRNVSSATFLISVNLPSFRQHCLSQ